MSDWNRDPEAEHDASEREVLGARMTPVSGPQGVNPVAELLAREVAEALENLNARRINANKEKVPDLLREGLPSLTSTAAGAIEGTLKSRSLDGELKQAQILATYAEARERNAHAEKLEAEAELARINAARVRLEAALETCRMFGVDPLVALGVGGIPTIVLGAGLAEQHLGAPAAPPQLAAGAEPITDTDEVEGGH
jgi:hypothetical protein